MIKALIFDYFGVIRPHGDGVRSAYRLLGGDVDRDDIFITDLITADGYGFAMDIDQQFADQLGVSVDTWRKALVKTDYNDSELLAYVSALRKRGFRTGLLSNAGARSLKTFFPNGDSDRYFDAVLLSGDSGHVKPEAVFYAMMAARLQVLPEECVMIDDREAFCEGAEYIGMKSIVYTNCAQLKQQLETLVAS